MKTGIIAIVTATAAFSLLTSVDSARGGFLLTDGNALPASASSFNYFVNNTPKFVNANVESAVYNKTGFQASFGAHPEINSADYVYVYQIFDNGTVPNATTQAVTFLSVGIGSGMAPYDLSSTNNGNGALIAPNSASFTTDLSSAKWSYTASPFLAVNSVSDFLFYASPFPNGTHSAAIAASGIVTPLNGTLPSPVPEPVSAAFLSFFAGAGLLARRRSS